MAALLRVYAYAGCDTCRRALAWLRERGLPFEVVDITTSPPPAELLRQALAQAGGVRARLFNTSGRSYRELGADRVKAMEDEEAVAALAADGRLIRRPFLVAADGTILTGFRPPEWERCLASPPGP